MHKYTKIFFFFCVCVCGGGGKTQPKRASFFLPYLNIRLFFGGGGGVRDIKKKFEQSISNRAHRKKKNKTLEKASLVLYVFSVSWSLS